MSQELVADRPANNRQTASLTLRQKILVAAVALTESAPTFTTADLVVRCWAMFPEAFSLKGHAAHADSNKVLAKLSGADGLAGFGWIELTGQSTYRVTHRGRRVAEGLHVVEVPRVAEVSRPAEALTLPTLVKAPSKRSRAPRSSSPTEPSKSTTLGEGDVAAMTTLARCDALRKFLRGSPLTFADACSFWGIGRVSVPTAETRVSAAGKLLERVVKSFGDAGPGDQRLPPLSTCYGLLNLHRLMVGRFARELAQASTAKSGAP